jgi:hypothetical protein
MFRFAKNATVAVALAGLVLAQPAMAVRSADALPAPGAKVMAVGHVGSPVRSSEQLGGVPVIGWVIAGAVVIAVIAIVASDKHKKSPG